jgi:predicted RNase H-like nuclease (RuvC/YqgF family)
MATKKTAKVQAEIEKARAKLAEQQARVKELEQKRTELENLEIVDIVRGMSIPLDDLGALLQSIKGGAAPAPTSGQLGPKSVAANTTTDKEDESE